LARFAKGRTTKPAASLAPDDLEQFLTTLKGYDPVYIRHHEVSVRAMIRWGVKHGHLPNGFNPDYSYPLSHPTFRTPCPLIPPTFRTLFAQSRVKRMITAHTFPLPITSMPGMLDGVLLSVDSQQYGTYGEIGVGGPGITARLTAMK
jgi:hypothetical protein